MGRNQVSQLREIVFLALHFYYCFLVSFMVSHFVLQSVELLLLLDLAN